MSVVKSIILVFILFFMWNIKTEAKNSANLKRYIVKRKIGFSVEYHSENPSLRSIQHLHASDKKIIGAKSFESYDPEVLYAEEDKVLKIQLNATRSGQGDQFDEQWSLGLNQGGIEIEDAWDLTTGDSSVVVAVVDTGILNHNELSGRVLSGYDFVSDFASGNDGNQRDSDASDPGDWIDVQDPCFLGQTRNSSWHGTHVAGIIAANGQNSAGMSGVDLNAKILPVRVLGKCGGFTSDIADGIRWAAGGQVNGVPINNNPAKVINLSLGGRGSCSPYMQDAINFARSKRAVVIVAAGNDGVSIDSGDFTPANCQGVITVASNNQYGEKSSFSNYGTVIDITAPGGGLGGGVLSLGNFGTRSPMDMTFVSYDGTSMATPHVAAVASLILAVNPGLYPDQIEDIIERGAKEFSFNSSCTSLTCGGGILNAYQSILIAQTTAPDSSFRVDDVVIKRRPIQGDPSFSYSEESVGGFCGSIDLSNGDNNSGSGPLSLTIIFSVFLLLMKSFKVFKV